MTAKEYPHPGTGDILIWLVFEEEWSKATLPVKLSNRMPGDGRLPDHPNSQFIRFTSISVQESLRLLLAGEHGMTKQRKACHRKMSHVRIAACRGMPDTAIYALLMETC